jgi:hypothetical protein
MIILTLNAGSNSLKFEIIRLWSAQRLSAAELKPGFSSRCHENFCGRP